MTRFPTEDRSIKGLSGEGYERYETGVQCVAPNCTREGTERHHLFSRALMAGAYEWVLLPDGTETGNIIPLCNSHHRQVTENKVHITFQQGEFRWDNEPILYQPPRRGDTSHLMPEEEEHTEMHAAKGPGKKDKICGECGRAMPQAAFRTRTTDKKKVRKTWSCAIPWTTEENGAEVLDNLLESASEKMDQHGINWGEGHKVVYYRLTTALALFVLHADEILGNQ